MGTDLFDQLVGELPPSTVDVVGIVRREKRRSTARRVTGLATAVAALGLTTALGLSMTGGTGASSPPSVAGGGTTAAPDTRFALVAQSEETAAASAKRLAAALDAAVRKEAPDAKWIFEPDGSGRTGPDGRPPTLSYDVGPDGKSKELFGGGSGILNEGRKGSLRLGVEPAEGVGEDGVRRPSSWKCAPTVRKCTEGTAPSGAKTLFLSPKYGDVQMYGIEVQLPDGRSLRITVSNNFGDKGTGAAQPGTPLTSDQVKAIAFDVAAQIKA